MNARARFRSWSRRHGYSLLSSVGALVRNPLANGLTIAVLAIALSLPLGLYTALLNLGQAQQNFDRLDSVSVFLQTDVDESEARRIGSRITSRADVIAVDPVSPEQGMRELAGATGLDRFELGDVPLPWLLQVIPEAGADPDALADALRRLERVDLVVVDLEWVRRFDAILGVFNHLVRVLAALFALAVLFVISNNIRTDIERNREEIEVMALVGATPGYIRRPFLYAGLWMGLAGALLAWLLVLIGLAGSILPALPGTPLILAGFVLMAWLNGFVNVG
ncbi:MAG: cell division protein FtsX, partial [Wenzhouxiangellaceae bacterium]